VYFLGQPIKWVKTEQYLGVKLYAQITRSVHVNQVGKKAAQRLGVLGLILNRRSCLSFRNSVLFYKQLIHSMMDYALPIWRSSAFSHVRMLQELESKGLRIANNELCTLVTGMFMRGWGSRSLRTYYGTA
jgi:hypothetical protein